VKLKGHCISVLFFYLLSGYARGCGFGFLFYFDVHNDAVMQRFLLADVSKIVKSKYKHRILLV
jgi:hypothetical protein